jgi:hypothetical protein
MTMVIVDDGGYDSDNGNDDRDDIAGNNYKT